MDKLCACGGKHLPRLKICYRCWQKEQKIKRDKKKAREAKVRLAIKGKERKEKKIANKIWSSSKADIEFSKWIRNRDGKCLRCGSTENLTCSHFWSRRCSALRYEPDNCITLCAWKCHIFGWEKEKQGEYRDFMIQRLGLTRYEELKRTFYQSKITRREAIINCMKLLGVLRS